ncbi:MULTISPECIES: MutS-related protein [Flavobacteriaceae]|uniref:DNA mismatch repair protein MutS n=2 Tax=Flavobacteriaceae TaxID=49546 RepID=A0A4Y8ARE3_9FLAO|nr:MULTISPECIES: DNA mismatch repair protein MutS [Flavobacteriaceae]TEW72571.1 DNA mismatch repair protein MutS [Gramella jeungdoensis]GGK54634.1 DNA mismatch repair protein MutS [Lutibacter litoralis]
MQDPQEFYTSQKSIFEQKSTQLKKKLSISSTLRFLTFSAIILGIYLFFGNISAMLLVVGTGIIVFIYLVLKHSDLQYNFNLNKTLISINQTELSVLKRDYLNLDDGSEFLNPKHFYSYDIDLFGKGSFFQYCNRTVTVEGKDKLFSELTSNSISAIKEKQSGIKELSEKPIWRQHFSAIASLVKVEHPAKEIINWIHNYKAVFPTYFKYLPAVFSVLSLTLIVVLVLQLIPEIILLLWLFIGLGISGFYVKKVNELSRNTDNAKDTFKQYHKLLNEIEQTTFTSEILKNKQLEIQTDAKKASAIFKEYSKLLDALDQRNNVIIAVLGNGFFLRDLHQVYKIENWIATYKTKVEQWFKVIAFFDAQNSLANFAFNHSNYVFPEIKNNDNVIKATNLGHTLLKEGQRIDNDFTIKNQQFFIITGANMAGKSTFLRTVSLSIVMANIGLPVCAEHFEYSPIKLITSMRTSDSLVEDESYFFSELKRLKFIVDEIENDDYFIILDEILKGTNSTDKAIGSKKFVQKLVASNSTGIIATHDLSLCEIEKELTEVKNYYFDAEIISDELNFDYQLKDGICKNMNASFLLKKMKIV